MIVLFLTFNPVDNSPYGGSKASTRNYKVLAKYNRVDVYTIKKRNSFFSFLSILSFLYPPVSIADFVNIRKIIRKKKYDLVFLDSSLLGCFVGFFNKRGVDTCVCFHNFEKKYNWVRFSNRSIKSVLYSIVANQSERKACHAKTKFCFTQRDKYEIERSYRTSVDSVIPIGIEDFFEEDGVLLNSDMKGYCLLFGPYCRANYEGFSWFAQNVSPFLKVKTVIAGKGFEQVKLSNVSEKVEVIGYVDDLNSLYRGAICVAIPLFSGSGMKIKTAEAFMHGKYVVGTGEAFVGYDVTNLSFAKQCDEAEEFIKTINDLSYSKTCFIRDSRNLFLEKYDLFSAEAQFRELGVLN